MTSLALVVTVPESDAELAADLLWSLGVQAVEERDGQAVCATSGDAAGDAAAGRSGRLVELWTSLGDDHRNVAVAAECFPGSWRWRLVEIDPATLERWREHVEPTWVADDCVIVPAWAPHLLPDARSASGPPTIVLIDPGAAFGMGDHPTTVASLRSLRNLRWSGATVLDVGCGSGVLGIVAAMDGAHQVRAIDISLAAIEATAANAARNGVDAVIDADDTPLADLTGPYDVVVANILAPTLIELADDLRRVTAPGGVLIVSGVLAGGSDHVLEALSPMTPIEEVVVDGWVAITLKM